jgi:hypothetical protein
LYCFIASFSLFLHGHNGFGNTAILQNPPNLSKEVLEQSIGVGEFVGSAGIVLCPVPVISRRHCAFEPRARCRGTMGVVEADQPCAIRSMQRK